MARIPYVGDEPELAETYGQIAGLRGSVRNLHRVLANQPDALRAFMGMSRYIRDESSLDPRLRELAILSTGYALDVAYEIHDHRIAARRVGVSDEQLAAFPRWGSATCFSPLEQSVLAYADQVARARDVDDATFGQLKERLSNAEILDLVLTVGWYHLCAAILVPLRVEVESD